MWKGLSSRTFRPSPTKDLTLSPSRRSIQFSAQDPRDDGSSSVAGGRKQQQQHRGRSSPASSGPAPGPLAASSLTADEVASLRRKYARQISNGEDFNKMFKEVQTEGSKQFTGYAKKLYKEEEYLEKTGKKMKRQVRVLSVVKETVNYDTTNGLPRSVASEAKTENISLPPSPLTKTLRTKNTVGAAQYSGRHDKEAGGQRRESLKACQGRRDCHGQVQVGQEESGVLRGVEEDEQAQRAGAEHRLLV